MALARVNLVLQEDDGDIVDGASVEVRNEATLALAPVFSDRDGTVSLGNPFTAADGGDAGFYVAAGAYKITATLSGFTRTIRYQASGLSAEQDYSEGTWTPVLTAATGSLTVAYGTQTGTYTKVGRLITCHFSISTSSYNVNTGSSQLTIEGLPFAANDDYVGTLLFSGINKPFSGNSPPDSPPSQGVYTQFAVVTANGLTAMAIECSASGVAISNLQVSNTATGTNIIMRGVITYWSA